MNKLSSYILAIIAFVLMLSSCENNSLNKHFIKNARIRREITNDFNNKIAIFDGAINANNLIDSTSNLQEKEALQFLYAYMPVGDMLDRAPEEYKIDVQTALKARKEMPWGDSIPDIIFRHFVLPPRVNNENIDNSRLPFYMELKPLVENKSMYDAALEVNHWCHEKVEYKVTDSRTSSPLSTVKTAYGRCGEESVFAVAAMRSVGIPARQVYTPRWAHRDDNHAWVEVWISGQWHFLGACEPEPRLDLAWFTSDVKRALLVQSRVFGKYNGPEDKIDVTKGYTTINVTSDYAPVRQVKVKVLKDAKPVRHAWVEYKIYNYSELFTAIAAFSDASGVVSASLGLGDVLVWASKDGYFGYKKVDIRKLENSTVSISLDHKLFDDFSDSLILIPPIKDTNKVIISSQERSFNDWRKKNEDKIREKYVSSFPDDAEIDDFISRLKVKVNKNQKERIKNYIKLSRGNWNDISTYISALDQRNLEDGLYLLDQISKKDLRDTPADILFDHIDNFSRIDDYPKYITDRYILNPRIADELLSPWRRFLQTVISDAYMNLNDYNKNKSLAVHKIIDYINSNIKIIDGYDPLQIPITAGPIVYDKISNSKSLKIFFVAVCRSLNIPSRIKKEGGDLQYYYDNKWINVKFSVDGDISYDWAVDSRAVAGDGASTLPCINIKKGKYAVSRFISDGSFKLLSLDVDSQGRTPEFDRGYYILTRGEREKGGGVKVHMNLFTIKKSL